MGEKVALLSILLPWLLVAAAELLLLGDMITVLRLARSIRL